MTITTGVTVVAVTCIVALAAAGISANYFESLSRESVTITGYREDECDDIIRGTDGILRCEIMMQAEDDNIRIFKGTGAIDG